MNRTVVVASADEALQERLANSLTGMRWQVRIATGAADAMAKLDENSSEALLLDTWLPDLEVGEFASQMVVRFPAMDLLSFGGDEIQGCTKSPRRHELLHAIREAHGASQRREPDTERDTVASLPLSLSSPPPAHVRIPDFTAMRQPAPQRKTESPSLTSLLRQDMDEMVGGSAVMQELARMIRLVAPRNSTVLIEGETGTGKELVAQALHRLSPRSAKPMVVLNCAAIPETLLEAELFGHTRGAFTGATHSRTGRIEAAHGSTLFLDEIGEMSMVMQAKMLRFLENGELQRVGDNDMTRVDVRIIAATHQYLERRADEGTFRLDLYHRLTIFPIEVPPLRHRTEDILPLCEHFLALMGSTRPGKQISAAALNRLLVHDWPGNVRELAHVLERACILSEDSETVQLEHIRLRQAPRR